MDEITVKYNNDLNWVNFGNLSERDINLFMCILSKLKDKDTQEITIQYSTLKELYGFQGKHSNERLTQELDIMSDNLDKCKIKRRYGKVIEKMHLFEAWKLDGENGIITVSLCKKFAYLVNDFRGYTELELRDFIRLKSRHAKTLYRKLRQFRTTGKFSITLEEFKRIFDVPETTQVKYYKRDIITPAIKALANKFENLECKIIKSNRSGAPIKSFEFTFKPYGKGAQIEGQMSIDDVLEAREEEKIKRKRSRSRRKPRPDDFEEHTYDYDELEKRFSKN